MASPDAKNGKPDTGELEAWVRVKAKGFATKWHKRYAVVDKDGVWIYKDDEDLSDALVHLSMEDYNCERHKDDGVLFLPCLQGKQKNYFVRLDSDDMRSIWHDYIKIVYAKTHKLALPGERRASAYSTGSHGGSSGSSEGDIRTSHEPPEHVVQLKEAMTKLVFEEGNPIKTLNEVARVGKGASSKVYQALEKDGTLVAVKEMPFKNDKELRYIKQEVTLHKLLEQENLVKLLYAVMCENKKTVAVVMELMAGGNLTELIRYYKLEEIHIAYICCEVLKGLNYLHSKGLVHRDIKSSNILLSSAGEVKVADFGFLTYQEMLYHKLEDMKVGTAFWMAPEVASGASYDASADLWSLGITAIEMADRKPPHSKQSSAKALFRIQTWKAPTVKTPNKWSPAFNDFVATCCSKEPIGRGTAASLLEHPFLKKKCGAMELADIIRQAQVDAELDDIGF